VVTWLTAHNKNSRNSKGAITQERVDIVAICCKSNITFLLFAVLVAFCRQYSCYTPS